MNAKTAISSKTENATDALNDTNSAKNVMLSHVLSASKISLFRKMASAGKNTALNMKMNGEISAYPVRLMRMATNGCLMRILVTVCMHVRKHRRLT